MSAPRSGLLAVLWVSLAVLWVSLEALFPKVWLGLLESLLLIELLLIELLLVELLLVEELVLEEVALEEAASEETTLEEIGDATGFLAGLESEGFNGVMDVSKYCEL